MQPIVRSARTVRFLPRRPAAPRWWLVAALLVTVAADVATRGSTSAGAAPRPSSTEAAEAAAVPLARVAAIVQLAAEPPAQGLAACAPRSGATSPIRDELARADRVGAWLVQLAATEPATTLRGGLALVGEGLAWRDCDRTAFGQLLAFAVVRRGLTVVDAALAAPGLDDAERAQARTRLARLPSPTFDLAALLTAEARASQSAAAGLVRGLAVPGMPDGRAARWPRWLGVGDLALRLRTVISACQTGVARCEAALVADAPEVARGVREVARVQAEVVAALDQRRAAL